MQLRKGDIGMLHRAPATSLKRCCTTIVEWYNTKITVAGIPAHCSCVIYQRSTDYSQKKSQQHPT